MKRNIEGDTYRHRGMRANMCKELRAMGIKDEAVLAAMNEVPRHLFMDPGLDAMSYNNQALPIACGQTISRPMTVAYQTELLELQPMMKVLEVGTGSGYQTAVLCELKARVYSVERQKELYLKTKRLLERLRYNANCFLGDGYNGLAEMDFSPYDRILVTCGASEVPQQLLSKLKVGGLMVIPVGDEQQTMHRILRTGPESYETSTCGDFQFVPMLKGRQF